MRKKILAPIIVFVGLLGLHGGCRLLASDSATCGTGTMPNGETCRQRKDEIPSDWFVIGFGSLMTIYGIGSTYSAYRRPPPTSPFDSGPHDQEYYRERP